MHTHSFTRPDPTTDPPDVRIKPKTKKIVCEYCGRNNKKDEEFCKSCGAPLPEVRQSTREVVVEKASGHSHFPAKLRVTKAPAHNNVEDDYYYHYQAFVKGRWTNWGWGVVDNDDKVGIQKLYKRNQPLEEPEVVLEWIN
jgi:hypothetical protein